MTTQRQVPEWQQVMIDRCYHPTGAWEEFPHADIEQPIGQRFEKMVALYPDRLAIQSDTSAFSYAELNGRANQIGRTILAMDAMDRSPIGLLLEKNPLGYAAILGILKTGRPFVILNPALPKERLDYLWDTSQAGLIVTDGEHSTLASDLAGTSQRCIDIGRIEQTLSPDNFHLPVSPDQFAVIAYTSGSTGQPKGVCHTHRTLLHVAMRLTNLFHFCPQDRRGILRTFGTLTSFTDVAYALLNGGAAILYDTQRQGVQKIAHWLVAQRITTTVFVPTLYRQFMDALPPDLLLPDLRLIILGGESITQADIMNYRERLPATCLLSLGYGLTELVSATMYLVDRENAVQDGPTPSGYPMQDIEISILDKEYRSVEPGQGGEIALSSPYLAQGYWGQPDLTAARFLPGLPGKNCRTYLTGDMGLLQPDGCLIHLNRTDFQVKIRGLSVNMTEVEDVLQQLERVQAAAVVALPDHAGTLRLVAYIVSHQSPPPSVTALRRSLLPKLPGHMLPSVFVFLDELPQTASGKIDRKALPPPSTHRPPLDVPFANQRTPIEQITCTLWADILGLDEIGIYDPFLELGGDSLKAMRIAARVQDEFGVEIPLAELFAAATVAEMALAVVAGLVDEAAIAGIGDR